MATKVDGRAWGRCARTLALTVLGAVAAGSAAAQTDQPWYGEHKLSCQWAHFFYAEDPANWRPDMARGYGEDVNASYFYWSYPSPMPDGTRILIDGDFPYARMMNFQVGPPWDPQWPAWRAGEGAPEISLLDEDIEPDPGHTNPFRTGTDRRAEKRHFQVVFELRSGHPVGLNPQAGVPPYRAPGNLRIGGPRSGKDGNLGPYIWYRIYAPDRYHPYGGVALPRVRIQLPGQEPQLAGQIAELWTNERSDPQYRVAPFAPQDNPCLANGRTAKDVELAEKRRQFTAKMMNEGKWTEKPFWIRLTLNRFSDSDDNLVYYKLFGHPNYYCTNSRSIVTARLICPGLLESRYNRGPDKPPPGNDEHTNGFLVHNTYLSSAAFLEPGRILVVHAKAPRTPKTLRGQPTMESSAELRYWSLCLSFGRPALVALDCLMDENVIVRESGYFTIVLARNEDRPRNARADCGVTWLPWRGNLVNVAALLWRYLSTSADAWRHAPQRLPWARGDLSRSTYEENALKNLMGEYYPSTRYANPAEFDSAGCNP